MAISNYSELKTAVANWLDRTDLTNRIPEFIALAEARFNRDLRIRAMETRSTATVTTRYTGLPGGYLQMRNVQLNTSPVTSLEYLTPEMMDRLWAGSTTGVPVAYTIIGDELQLGPIPDSGYTLEMAYYKKFDALSDAATTNWVISNAPDVYLYGALLEAEPYLKNDARVELWIKAYARAVESLQDADDRDRHSGSAMRVMTESGNP